jgi:hypothetical protein
MMMDVDQAAKAMRDEEMAQEIEDFLEGFNQPTYRGMRVNGQRVATWSSQHGWSGDGRPEAEWLQCGLSRVGLARQENTRIGGRENLCYFCPGLIHFFPYGFQ